MIPLVGSSSRKGMDLNWSLLNYLTESSADALESRGVHFEIPQHAQIWPFEEYFCYLLGNLSKRCSRRASVWRTEKDDTVRRGKDFIEKCDFIAGGAQHLMGISIRDHFRADQAHDIFNDNTAKTMSDENERARALGLSQ